VSEVRRVSKVEFYKLYGQPVFGIVIETGDDCLRFGTTLSDEERDWLCWEIEEFVRRAGTSAPLNAVAERS
jgi:hypothetical protein